MSIAIVGGAGFVGQALASELAKKYLVRIIDNRPPAKQLFHSEYVKCNVLDQAALKEALSGAEVVIHAAIIQIPEINDNKRPAYEVNVHGIENVCKVVDEANGTLGMILCGSWHVLGDHPTPGTITDTSSYDVNNAEDRARLYVLTKLCQEGIVRSYNEFSAKNYLIIRSGTVLGEGMSEKTAASIFIKNALSHKPITVFRDSMSRPMFFVDLYDLCHAYELACAKILSGDLPQDEAWPSNVFGVYYPQAITIMQIAQMVREEVEKQTNGKVIPEIQVVETAKRLRNAIAEHRKLIASVERTEQLCGRVNLTPPAESLRRLIRLRLSATRRDEPVTSFAKSLVIKAQQRL